MLRFVGKKSIGLISKATRMPASLLPCALTSVYLSSCSVLWLLSVQPELAALDQVNALARLSPAEFTAGRLEKRAPSTESKTYRPQMPPAQAPIKGIGLFFVRRPGGSIPQAELHYCLAASSPSNDRAPPHLSV